MDRKANRRKKMPFWAKGLPYLAAAVLLLCSCTVLPETDGRVPFSQVLDGCCRDVDGNPVTVRADYYLVYYAADWCPYCSAYADELKATYARLRRMYGNVEIVFAGHERDTSNDNMVSFLRQGDYPFPYVTYESREKTGIMHLVDVPKFWIPGFVLLDRYGRVLSSSNGNDKASYSRDRPLRYYEALQQCDCLSEGGR